MNLSKLKFGIEIGTGVLSQKDDATLMRIAKKMIKNYLRIFNQIPLPNKDVHFLVSSFDYAFWIDQVQLFEDMNYVDFVVLIDEESYVDDEKRREKTKCIINDCKNKRFEGQPYCKKCLKNKWLLPV